MNGIYLTNREKRLLFLMRFKKKHVPKDDVSTLVSHGLIAHTYSGRRNAIGEAIPDATYSLTDKAVRYRIAKREDRWKRIITPITVTILTDAVLHGIRWLAEWLPKLLKQP